MFAREKEIFLSAVNRGVKSFSCKQAKHQKLKLEYFVKEFLISIYIHPSFPEDKTSLGWGFSAWAHLGVVGWAGGSSLSLCS